MKVLVFDQQQDLVISKASVKPVVKSVLVIEGAHTDEIAVYFVTKKEISKLHSEFFNDPTPTDCISFPLDGPGEKGYNVLGEIFICPKTALDFVLTLSEELGENVYFETTLYLVHGLLHLLGHDDQEEGAQKKMQEREQLHMERLIKEGLLLKQ
ncbi:MAG: rRNA maturation RNase YbeY [Chlamydiia bacterium]|nr:rRNA maturation RNase YbeY [Chlamydiia bacterium]